MKKQTGVLFATIANTRVKHLTTIVSETLALELTPAAAKPFTAAQLWNIQKTKKAFGQRRYIA